MNEDLRTELFNIKEQIDSLESLGDVNEELNDVLRQLRVCYNELRAAQTHQDELQNGSNHRQHDEGGEDQKPDPKECGENVLGSNMLGDSWCSLDNAQEEPMNISAPWSCAYSNSSSDELLEGLIKKAHELREHYGCLNAVLADFIWSVYLYGRLECQQIVAFNQQQWNGGHEWFMGVIVDLDIRYYKISDVQAILQKNLFDTLLELETLRTQDVCESNDEESFGNDVFPVVSGLQVAFRAPRKESQVPCRFLGSLCLRGTSCRFHHGLYVTASQIRLFREEDNMKSLKIGSHVLYQPSAKHTLWLAGQVVQQDKESFYIKDKESDAVYTIYNTQQLLPDLDQRFFTFPQLPGEQPSQAPLVSPCTPSDDPQHSPDIDTCDEEHMKDDAMPIDDTTDTVTQGDSSHTSLVNIFGGWEKHTKGTSSSVVTSVRMALNSMVLGFGLRMLMKLGYKKGDALSPPSWKPSHSPKCVEPLKIRILRPRAGLDFINKKGRDVHFANTDGKIVAAREKQRLEKKINSGTFGFINMALAQPPFVTQTLKKLRKGPKTLISTQHECRGEDALRRSLISLEQREMECVADIEKIKRSINRHTGVGCVNVIRSNYLTQLHFKNKTLDEIHATCRAIREELECLGRTSALKTF